MGTLVPVLGTLTKTIGAVSTIAGAVDSVTGNSQKQQQEQAMRNLQAQQQQQSTEAQATADEKRNLINLEAQEAEDIRKAALKRAIAKRNAKFGATGIGGTGGSREAILLGLYDESDTEKQRQAELDKLRFNAIDNDLSNLQSRNILQQTQLAEQQRLQSLSSRF
jgi:hypothetical protein